MNTPLPCLILAGGLGTRLRSVLGDACPKALALVGGRPFLGWLLQSLEQQGVPEMVLSLGFGHDSIKFFVAGAGLSMPVHIVEEKEPLGTGGAIVHALRTHSAPAMVVMNGDTMCELDMHAFCDFFRASDADMAMAATRVDDASRYGTLAFDETTRRLLAFAEKRDGAGFINAGIYAIDARRLLSHDHPQQFSFERDYLSTALDAIDVRVYPDVGEFIDIGVPGDYARAQTFIPNLFCTSVDES